MCCQITPAIGIDPMKPMTTMRLRFITQTTHEARRPTSKVQLSALSVERRTLTVEGRRKSFAKALHDPRRISGNDGIWFDILRRHRTSRDDRVFANCHALQDHGVHTDPDVVRDFNRSCLELGAAWAALEVGCQSRCVHQALRRLERMKIRVGYTDVP